MNKSKVFKIKKFMKYSLKQYAVYSVLACYTDKNQVSHISREVLSQLSGVSDLDTISKYTNQFTLDGLIKKESKYSPVTGKKFVEYTILEPQDDYLFCTNKLFSGNAELIGFLCLLAQYKVGNTNTIKLTSSALIKKIGIGRTTFYKYMKLALQDGSVLKTDDGYVLSDEIFPTFEHRTKPSKEETKRLKELSSDPSSVEAKILSGYYDKNTNTVLNWKSSIEDLINFCLSGVPKRGNKVQQPDIKYIF